MKGKNEVPQEKRKLVLLAETPKIGSVKAEIDRILFNEFVYNTPGYKAAVQKWKEANKDWGDSYNRNGPESERVDADRRMTAAQEEMEIAVENTRQEIYSENMSYDEKLDILIKLRDSNQLFHNSSVTVDEINRVEQFRGKYDHIMRQREFHGQANFMKNNPASRGGLGDSRDVRVYPYYGEEELTEIMKQMSDEGYEGDIGFLFHSSTKIGGIDSEGFNKIANETEFKNKCNISNIYLGSCNMGAEGRVKEFRQSLANTFDSTVWAQYENRDKRPDGKWKSDGTWGQFPINENAVENQKKYFTESAEDVGPLFFSPTANISMTIPYRVRRSLLYGRL